MQYDGLVTGLAAVLGGITVVMTVLGLVYNPAILFVALTFAAATYLVYYHASGRLAARVYRRVERRAAVNAREGPGRRGGFGAGPRDDWTPPREGATARGSASRASGGVGRREADASGQRARRRVRDGPAGPSPAQAYRTLGLEPGADETSVKRAYREKVKEVHPDADGGDAAQFKAVTAAYETLTD